MSRLPIEEILPLLRETLNVHGHAVLTAPPGAGKTTRVPLELLDLPWMQEKKLAMLEPRRLAARAAAHRMASMLNEAVGQTVGYRMRLDTKVGPDTRIEVVTEGVLTRLLQRDPALGAYAGIIFDEFHERSLQADAGLTLCLETQRLFRPDLRLLVMSATLDCGPVSALLGEAPVIVCQGHSFPVEIHYLDRPVTKHLDIVVTQMIRRSLARDQGSLLVFLPGMAEIRRVERRLLEAQLDSTIHVMPLHGDLPQSVQDAAMAPATPGTRKIVLATSIAETSLTIDGVRVVVDAGRMRVSRFDPRSGLTRLDTICVTHDSAEQRRGRAGRLEAGVCYRLWTEQEQATLSARRPPEILDADLAPLILDLAVWGNSDPSELTWLTEPSAGAVAGAKELLTRLGAIGTTGHVTPHGTHMAELPLHPRLAHMLIRSVPLSLSATACDIAALLSERDILRSVSGCVDADLRLRLDILQGRAGHAADTVIDRGQCQRVKQTSRVWRRQLARQANEGQADTEDDPHAAGLLLALAYPDRIAQRQPGHEPRYLLANGRGALFPQVDPLASEPYLVIADLDGGVQWAAIHLAAPLSRDDIESLYGSEIAETESVEWDDRSRTVRASKQRRYGALLLSEQALSAPDPLSISSALLEGVRRTGLAALAWTPELRQWRARVQFLARVDGDRGKWPDLSDGALLRDLEHWLGPYVVGITSLDRIQRLDLRQPLHGMLTWEQQRQLERQAPTHWTVPSGSSIRIEYETPDLPILAVRLQEMFGCKDTPRIADAKIPLLLHLLSPAKRPVQVTKDLVSFWAQAYQDVRKELRGRYPKHHWPEDPLTAIPTSKAKRRL